MLALLHGHLQKLIAKHSPSRLGGMKSPVSIGLAALITSHIVCRQDIYFENA